MAAMAMTGRLGLGSSRWEEVSDAASDLVWRRKEVSTAAVSLGSNADGMVCAERRGFDGSSGWASRWYRAWARERRIGLRIESGLGVRSSSCLGRRRGAQGCGLEAVGVAVCEWQRCFVDWAWVELGFDGKQRRR
ncbi:hypothetical protein M0R45_009059 [Rubus argutus]|uniref:Uncharacterized protein n=1 Tax=Rubus argutus TaxID=59490 RepID=A0AAW1Y3M4_RUBAR